MSYFNLIKTKVNIFLGNLSHTLINYFFGIFIKREHNLNKNCYIQVNKKNHTFLDSKKSMILTSNSVSKSA